MGLRLVAQGVFHLHIVLLGAEDDADGRVVAGSALLVVQQVQVEVHLAGVFRFERPDFQFKGHQGFEKTVIEKQVDEILLLAQRQPVLTADKAEAVAEFEEEMPAAVR